MTKSDQRRALLLPQEFSRLKPAEAILIRRGMFRVWRQRILYFKDKTFSQLVRRPPDVAAIDIVVRMDKGKSFGPFAAIHAHLLGEHT